MFCGGKERDRRRRSEAQAKGGDGRAKKGPTDARFSSAEGGGGGTGLALALALVGAGRDEAAGAICEAWHDGAAAAIDHGMRSPVGGYRQAKSSEWAGGGLSVVCWSALARVR